jgi:branched-subunit amino acid ABC-type transport system permease component
MSTGIMAFVVAGLVTGALYGLAATGLVLTYKTSGIFNFAHGAIGAASAYLFFELRDERGVPWPLALLVSVGLVASVIGLLLSLVAARLAQASTARRVVATVGVLLVVQGMIQLRYGLVPKKLDTSFPAHRVNLAGTLVGYDQLITIAIAVSGLIGLGALFRKTRLGLEMRAVVDNGELLDLAGGIPRRVRAAAWMIGSAFAGLSGVLFAPAVGLNALLLTLLVVQAFGAAAIGRFRSLNVTFLGGLVIGVTQLLLRSPQVVNNVPGIKALYGLDQSVSFLTLFMVLLLLRRGTFSDPPMIRAARTATQLSTAAKAPIAAGAVVALGLLPVLVPSRSLVFIQGAVFVTIFASLFLLVEVSGQVSLCQAAFVAVGAAAFCHFTTGAGVPWLVGALLAVAVAIPLGAVVAIPAIRLSGVFLALATFGFGILVEQMAYTQPIMFGTLNQRAGARPHVFGLDSDKGYFYLCAAVAVAAIVIVLSIRRSRLGRLLNALADSPVALVTHGASINVTRVLVFCLSAAMAATGGVLYVGIVGSVSGAGTSPSALVSFNSLMWLAALAFSGRNPVLAPILAAFALVVGPSYITSTHLAQYLMIGFGAAATLTSVFSGTLTAWVAAQQEASDQRLAHSPVRARTEAVHG